METTDTGKQTQPQPDDPLQSYGWLVTWFVSAFAVLVGLALVLGGGAILLTVDEAVVAEMVAEESLRSDMLTDAQLIEGGTAAFWWTGLGVALTGLATVAAGVGFFGYRRRRPESETRFATNAILGAVVTAVTSFVPFSTVLGGLAAGYLQHDDRTTGGKVGAASGIVAFAPLGLVVIFLFVGLIAGALAIQETAGAAVLVALLLFTLAVSIVVSGGLGAIGGYLGALLAEDDDGTGPAEEGHPA